MTITSILVLLSSHLLLYTICNGLSFTTTTNIPYPRPIVIWHGMGDAASSKGMQALKHGLELALPNNYVHLIAIADSEPNDRKASYLDDINRQVDQVCQDLQRIPQLHDGFDAIGFSQGGLFLRALVEQCVALKVGKLITWASPHQGIAKIPSNWCTNQPLACKLATWFLEHGAYLPQIQRSVVQAGYIKIPDQYDKYLNGNLFLPLINNEHVNKSIVFKHQLQNLELFILVKHTNDTMLNPPDSAWFSEQVKIGQDLILSPVRNTSLYQNDWIGLKDLDSRQKLVFIEVPGDHMQITIDQVLNLLVPYLNPYHLQGLHFGYQRVFD